jgi:DNA-binding HxlR family transcriptional regulator
MQLELPYPGVVSRKRFKDMHCGVAQALEQVGDWWTLLVVREAFFGTRRFDDFQAQLGIARNILSDRLRRLVDNGILVKAPADETGRRPLYELTAKGRDLWIVMTALRLWSDRWVFGRGNEPLLVKDRDSGATLSALMAVDEHGRPLEPRRLGFAAGPGATRAERERLARPPAPKPRTRARPRAGGSR